MATALPKYAYTTLITRSSYLGGVLLLAYSLRKHDSKYPLVVLYTPNLPSATVAALRRECAYTNIQLALVEPLLPPDSKNQPNRLIAARFEDTWTKLRVFSLPLLFDYSKVCYLDADMLIFNKNMDEIFAAAKLPDDNYLAANHVCCCNLDGDSWAPEDWKPENCAYTGLAHPQGLSHPTPVPRSSDSEGKETHKLFNSGMFLFIPSSDLWERMQTYFDQCDHLSEFLFPDQDFLAEFFHDRWVSLGWQYNALKTMRYWHEEMWRDDEVICLHYIVDKPWAARVGLDGRAGYKGGDGVTHQWWWDEFARWESERKEQGEEELLRVVRENIAPRHGENPEAENEDLNAIGSQAQAFANNREVK